MVTLNSYLSVSVHSRENGNQEQDVSSVSSPRQSHLSEAQHGWHLMVNFGKRYTRLQQLLEWLEIWSNKQHKFGLGHHEAVLELKVCIPLASTVKVL
jgi:hypothetical protein